MIDIYEKLDKAVIIYTDTKKAVKESDSEIKKDDTVNKNNKGIK